MSKIKSGKIGNSLFAITVVLGSIWFFKWIMSSADYTELLSNQAAPSEVSGLKETDSVSSDIGELENQNMKSSSGSNCERNNRSAAILMSDGFNVKAMQLLDPGCESYSEIYSQLLAKRNSEKSKRIEIESAILNQEIELARRLLNELKSESKDSDLKDLEKQIFGHENLINLAKSNKFIIPAVVVCGDESSDVVECHWDYIKNGNPVRDTSNPDLDYEYHPCHWDGAVRFDRLNSKIVLSNKCVARFITDQSDTSKTYYKKISCGGFLNKNCEWNFNKNGEPVLIRSISGKCDEGSYRFDRYNNMVNITGKCKGIFETRLNY